ncbi:MAG TPA: DUF2061 domain-containing protein [Halobacteriales archaeon]|uniref:DUF2061 domain-containing protein n=1 Tax=Candidatus Hikarchaeum yamanae TaxID=2675326 RepID=UPI00181B8751|nr:DUF2061 domain-containing protein [Halobacteriales archaeon]|tara:strand:- start:811 stop:1080 length:270 start_codon:yes stop_codon:yes gene_type:complete
MFIKVDPKRLGVDTEGLSKASRTRSLLKALTWRTIATSDTFVISLFITGTISWAASIATLEVFTKTGLYYLHERGWDRIRLGQDKNDSS